MADSHPTSTPLTAPGGFARLRQRPPVKSSFSVFPLKQAFFRAEILDKPTFPGPREEPR